MSRKTFVIDTNVLLHDPTSLMQFPRHEVVIPVAVLEELEKLKRLPHELGRHAREAIRTLAALKQKGKGGFHFGIELENGAIVQIQLEEKTELRHQFALPVNDNRIIMAAFILKEQGKHVVFISKDFAARIKAEAIGIEAEDYENLKYSYDSLYKGIHKIEVNKHEIDTFCKDGKLPPFPHIECYPNSYFILTAEGSSPVIGRYDSKEKKVLLVNAPPSLWGIKPLNLEQRCAIDLLLCDEVKLVTLVGPAGTGKTLLALACALRKVFDEGEYSKILVTRPILPLGRDIGYLPGTKEEKLSHWMQPIYDNLELLCASSRGEKDDILDWVMKSKKIETEAATFIRGRSLPGMWLFVDEAQNLTPHEIKTFISRAGKGTKVILAGDPNQIDNFYLNKDSNGLTFTVGKFLGQEIFGHIVLDKTERSALAALAAEIL